MQLEAELKQSQKDCSSIKTAMSEATASLNDVLNKADAGTIEAADLHNYQMLKQSLLAQDHEATVAGRAEELKVIV